MTRRKIKQQVGSVIANFRLRLPQGLIIGTSVWPVFDHISEGNTDWHFLVLPSLWS